MSGAALMLMWIEFGLACVLIFLRPLWTARNPDWLTAIEEKFALIARRRRLSVLLIGLLALAGRIAILPVLHRPEPVLADEFAHLLAADTFAHGRVTNPTHPMWIHFETLHEIQQPTYASMYPPAQGLLLGIGQVIFGDPFWGVCLSVALFSAAVCWMLQEWISPEWAWLGGLIAVVRYSLFSYWADSYWGGAMAALGGALTLGALPRVWKTRRPRYAVIMGLGIVILANSRPYEGLVFCIPVAFVMSRWVFSQRGAALRQALLRSIGPLLVVLLLGASATGYYFWRVTGSAVQMPQGVNRATYAVAPYFLWQSPRPDPLYHHAEMREFYLHNELEFYEQSRSVVGFTALTLVKIFEVWLFYLGPALSLPLVIAVVVSPRSRLWRESWKALSWETRMLLIILSVSLVGLALEVFFFPHYEAALACVLLGLVIRAASYIDGKIVLGGVTGKRLTRLMVLLVLSLLAARTFIGAFRLSVAPDWPPTWYNAVSLRTPRARILAYLRGLSGKHLAIVRYRDGSIDGREWVYNRADIDAADVVWARDMGAEGNRELLEYFKDRHAWLVEPGKTDGEIRPYP